MKNRESSRVLNFLVMVLVVGCVLLPAPAAADGRRVISLDGTWQVAEGAMGEVPKTFDHQVAVPGLADMAQPAFEAVGVKDRDPRREAFWYRRTFSVPGPLPVVARLKVHKACYGTAVYLNGSPLGEHAGSFTPGYFDLREKLKGDGQPNELIVRVGASHTALGKDMPWGHDFEKIRYVPGIYDCVDLILCGSPAIENVQTVPDVPGKQVRVLAEINNPGVAETAAVVRCNVRDAKTHTAVGTAVSRKMVWKPGGQQTADLTLPLEGCRLWTPDDPYLYEVEVSLHLSVFRGPAAG
ncbi:MAG: hypothetical protein NTV46_03010 [Verrucomicrobia bacterium]|nr:hypothetical protein [Verrucomicrobiota bacterium]